MRRYFVCRKERTELPQWFRNFNGPKTITVLRCHFDQTLKKEEEEQGEQIIIPKPTPTIPTATPELGEIISEFLENDQTLPEFIDEIHQKLIRDLSNSPSSVEDIVKYISPRLILELAIKYIIELEILPNTSGQQQQLHEIYITQTPANIYEAITDVESLIIYTLETKYSQNVYSYMPEIPVVTDNTVFNNFQVPKILIYFIRDELFKYYTLKTKMSTAEMDQFVEFAKSKLSNLYNQYSANDLLRYELTGIMEQKGEKIEWYDAFPYPYIFIRDKSFTMRHVSESSLKPHQIDLKMDFNSDNRKVCDYVQRNLYTSTTNIQEYKRMINESWLEAFANSVPEAIDPENVSTSANGYASLGRNISSELSKCDTIYRKYAAQSWDTTEYMPFLLMKEQIAGVVQSVLGVDLGYITGVCTYPWMNPKDWTDNGEYTLDAFDTEEMFNLGQQPYNILWEEVSKFDVEHLSVQNLETIATRTAHRCQEIVSSAIVPKAPFMNFNISTQLKKLLAYKYPNVGYTTGVVNIVHPLLSSLIWDVMKDTTGKYQTVYDRKFLDGFIKWATELSGYGSSGLNFDLFTGINDQLTVSDRSPLQMDNYFGLANHSAFYSYNNNDYFPNFKTRFGINYLQMGELVNRSATALQDTMFNNISDTTMREIIKAVIKSVAGVDVEIKDNTSVIVNGAAEDYSIRVPKYVTLHSDIADVDEVNDHFINFVNEGMDSRAYLVRKHTMDYINVWFKDNENKIIDIQNDKVFKYNFMLEIELNTEA